MFSYQEPDAPAIWTHILNEASDFRIEKSINRDYARRLACKVIHVYNGNMTNSNDNIKPDDNARWKDVIYFDRDILNYALEVAKKRESCIDINKELSPDQQKSKKFLSELKKIAEMNYLTGGNEYKRSLVRKISEIIPGNEYYIEIRSELEKLKNNLELFNEQLSFLDINKLIALCVIYIRKELDKLSDNEKKFHAKSRINSLIKDFFRPVYQSVKKALDFTGSTGLREEIVEGNFKVLMEYADVISEDVIKRSRNHKIEFTEYPDLEIQLEINKIIDHDERKKENKNENTFFHEARISYRKRERLILINPHKSRACAKRSYGSIPLKLDMPRREEESETDCFSGLITKFSSIIKDTMIKTFQLEDNISDEDDFPYTLTL